MRGFCASVASACARSAVGVRHELARQLLVEEREQQMLGIELRVAAPARQLLRGRDGLL